MKISIGTAQLGLPYGINNSRKKSIRLNEFKKILLSSNKKKINSIDTAIAYGDSEKKIGQILSKLNLKNNFNITTKLPKIRHKKSNIIKDYVEEMSYQSLRKIGIKKFYSVLIHDIQDIKSNKKDIIFNALKNLKKKKITKKIGISCYSLKDLEKIIKSYEFDIVQIPFNIFDNRVLDKKILSLLKRKKIEIQIRSVFLQGLLLMQFNKIPKKLQKFKLLSKWRDFLIKYNLSPLEICISYVKTFNFYKNVIFGFDNYKQFKEVVKLYEKKIFNKNLNYMNKILKNNSNLINPSKW